MWPLAFTNGCPLDVMELFGNGRANSSGWKGLLDSVWNERLTDRWDVTEKEMK